MRTLIVLSLLIWMSACAGPSHLQRVAYQGDDLLIILDQQGLSSVPDFEGPYEHPAKISTTDMKKILSAVQVGPQTGMLMSLFSKGKMTPLFDTDSVNKITEKFSRALLDAGPLEKVSFYHMKPRDATHVTVTSGFFLVKSGKLHLRVNHYEMPLRKGRHPSRVGLGLKESEKRRYFFELLEGKQMAHRSYKNVLGLSGSDLHWLVIDYADFPDPAAEPMLSTPGTLEERLRTLKHLRDENLITEEEYRDKKKSLLKSF